MTWYVELMILGLMTVAGHGYMKGYNRLLMRKKAITKDDFQVPFQRLMKLEAERNLGKDVPPLLDSSKSKDINWRFDLSTGFKLLIYYGVASLVEWLLPNTFINSIVLTTGYAIAMLGYAHYDLRSHHKRALVHISQLNLTAPEEYKNHGLYAYNPFDVQGALEKLKQLERERNTFNKHIKRAQVNAGQAGRELGSPALKKELDTLTEGLDAVERHMRALTTCIQEELLTNKVPGYLAENPVLLEMKPEESLEEKAFEMVPAEKAEPHHIEVMKQITLDKELPQEVKERAETLVKRHEEAEAERLRKAKINEAVLDIETVEKYYEKNKEGGESV